MKMSIEHK